jgi:hypothetical protein
VHAGGSSGRDQAPSPANAFDSGLASPPRSSCQCKEYMLRILDLESHLSLAKRQTQMAMDKSKQILRFYETDIHTRG